MSQLTDAQLSEEAGIIKTETALGNNTAYRIGTMFVNSIDSKINIDAVDTNIALGSSDAKVPSQNAVKTYADGLVVGLVDDRGSFTPSVTSPGGYPTTGGSGTGGAIKKGDLWFMSAAGYLSTTAVAAGASVRALTDTPGQTASNWNILNSGLGFTPENVLNKSTNVALGTSNTLYPTQNAVKSYVDTNSVSLANDNTFSGSNTFTSPTTLQGETTMEGALTLNNSLNVGEDVPVFLVGSAGTVGQVLTSQGGTTNPIWTTPTPGISPASNTTFTGSNTFSQTTQFTAGILSPVGGTSTFNGTLDVNGFFRVDGQAGTAGQVLTSTGSGSTPIWADAGGGSGVTTIKSTLSSSDILQLFYTPFILIPAPGAGKILNVLKITFKYNFNTIAYSGTSNLAVRIGGSPLFNTIFNFLNATQTKIGIPTPVSNAVNATSDYINLPLEIINTSNLFSGNGTLDVYITYDTITL